MSNTAKIYPSTTAHQYWRDSSWTQASPYTRSFAGETSYTYLWPIPFDIVAYCRDELDFDVTTKIMRSLKLKVKVDDASNTFSGDEYLAVGVSATNNNAADAADATPLDSILPTITGDTWNEWDISDAWSTLKSGTAYLVMSGNEYGVLFNNYDTVAVADKPYIELEYDDGTIGYGTGGAYERSQVYYGDSGAWNLVKPYYGYGGEWKEIST